MQEKPPRWPNS